MRVRAAGREAGAVRAGLGPAVVPAEAVGLVGRLAGLQVGQGGQHGWDSGGGDVDRGAGRGVDVIPSVVRVGGLVGGQGQALIHLHNAYVPCGKEKCSDDFLGRSQSWRCRSPRVKASPPAACVPLMIRKVEILVLRNK